MALDLNAIKAKLERLKNNERESASDDTMWKPKPGEYTIRVLPWPDAPPGEPFKELSFYYDIGRNKVLAPESLGHDDPVRDLRIKCFEDGSAEMREVGKKLFSRSRAYAPIVVRGEEDRVRLLDMNKTLHQEMLAFFIDDDTSEYTDLKEGFDVKIVASEETMDKTGKKWTKLTPKIPRSHKRCPAAASKKQIDEWTAMIPNLNEMFKELSYDEMKSHVDMWLNGQANPSGSQSAGTEVRPPVAAKADGARKTSKATADIDDVFDKLDQLDEDGE